MTIRIQTVPIIFVLIFPRFSFIGSLLLIDFHANNLILEINYNFQIKLGFFFKDAEEFDYYLCR